MSEFDAETIDRIVKLADAASFIGTGEDGDAVLINGKQAVLVPEGYQLVQIDPIDSPLRTYIAQATKHDTDDSFIRYVNDFKTPSTRLFVGRSPAAVLAVLDYHGPSDQIANDVGRLAHRATYALPWSPQWLRWKSMADANGITQRDFMEFIEENGEDIRDPSAADLMQMIGKVQSRKKIEFTSGLRLSNGEVELAYKEEIENSGGAVQTATMPSEMTIGIPVFVEGPAYEIKVFIRYHVDGGKLAFELVLHRWEFTVDDAMKIAVQKIEESTSLEAHWGGLGER